MSFKELFVCILFCLDFMSFKELFVDFAKGKLSGDPDLAGLLIVEKIE